MLLTNLTTGQGGIIVKCTNSNLEKKGFVKGEYLKVISKSGSGYIVQIKDARYTITYDSARQISLY